MSTACSGPSSGIWRPAFASARPVSVNPLIVTPWRVPGVARYVAAGELGSGVYFNPVVPEDAARALREAL